MKHLKNKTAQRVLAVVVAFCLVIGSFSVHRLVTQANPSDVVQGSVVTFGNFDGTGFRARHGTLSPSHAMRWIVVERDGEYATLLAQQHLFHSAGTDFWGANTLRTSFYFPGIRPATPAPVNSWPHSHLNTYLNTYFIDNTFTATQRAAIVQYGLGHFYDHENDFAIGGQQYVVLPSVAEMVDWFDNDPLRMTSWHGAGNPLTSPAGNPAPVWTRTPGANDNLVMVIDGLAGIANFPDGLGADYYQGAVRPVMRVHLATMIANGAIFHGIPQDAPGVRSSAPTGDNFHPDDINTVTVQFSQRVYPTGDVSLTQNGNDIALTGARTWDALGRTLSINISDIAMEFGMSYTINVSGFVSALNGIAMANFVSDPFTTRPAFAYQEIVEFGIYNDSTLYWEIVDTNYTANTATLLLIDRLYVGAFRGVANNAVNNPGTNLWANSTIRADLNSDFLTNAFDTYERAAMFTLEGDYVLIPSAAEYYAWFPDPAVRNSHPGNARNWWLRNSASPHLRNAGAPQHHSQVMYVTMGIGRVAHAGAQANTIKGIRPMVIVCADFLDADTGGPTPPPVWPVRVTPDAGPFAAAATIAGIEINVGTGFDNNAANVDTLRNTPVLRGSVVLTETEALNAAADIRRAAGGDVRVVRYTDASQPRYYHLVSGGHPSTNNGYQWFFMSNNLPAGAGSLDLNDGDIILIQNRSWTYTHQVFWVDVTVVPDTRPLP